MKLVLPEQLSIYSRGKTELDINVSSGKDLIKKINVISKPLLDSILDKDGSFKGSLLVMHNEKQIVSVKNVKFKKSDVLRVYIGIAGG